VGLWAIDHGTHGQFGLHRDTDLAHEDQVEGRVQRCRDFCGDRHPAARQRQDGDFMTPEFPQRASEFASSIAPISERHDGTSIATIVTRPNVHDHRAHRLRNIDRTIAHGRSRPRVCAGSIRARK
jgi:hypothetical protein